MLHSLVTSRLAAQALAWLLTYAVHSTILLALAWGVSRRLGGRRLDVQEMVWRYALVGALATASLQLAFGQLGPASPAPLGGRWVLAAAPGIQDPVNAATLSGTGAVTPVAGRRLVVHRGWSLGELAAPAGSVQASGHPADAAATADVADTPAVATAATVADTANAAGSRPADHESARALAPAPPAAPRLVAWRWAALRPGLPVALWLACSLLLSAAYVRSWLLLRRRLRHRPQVVGGGALVRLGEMVRTAGIARPVRLTCTWRLRVPVALGGRTDEVCVPPRALFELSEEQQDALLAHELGHLVRRDPAWLLIGQLMVSLFFFQPLNWVARRRLRELSELLSDQWAVERTGRPLSLAGCLAEVAGWSLGAPRGAVQLPVPGIAGRPSHLAQRIRRLLDGTPPAAGGRSARRAAFLLLATALLAVTVAAPGIAARSLPKDAAATAAAAAADRARTAGQTAGEAASQAAEHAEVAATEEQAAQADPAAAEAPAGAAADEPRPAGDPSAADAEAAAADAAQAAERAAQAAGDPAAARDAGPAADAGKAGHDATPPPPGRGARLPAVDTATPAPDLQAERERLAKAAAQLAQLDRATSLSKEQIAQMSAAVERIGREMDGRLRRQLADLDRRIAAARGGATLPPDLPAHDLDRAAADLAGVTAQLHLSGQDMARMESALHQLDTAPPGMSPAEMKRLDAELSHLSVELPALLDQDIPHLDAALRGLTIELPKLSDEDLARLRAKLKKLPAELPSLSPADRARLQASLDKVIVKLPKLTDQSLERIRIQLKRLPAELKHLSAADRARIQGALDKLQIELPHLMDREHIRIALKGLPDELPNLSHEDRARIEASLDQLADHPPLSDKDAERIQQEVQGALQHLPREILDPAERERLRAEIQRAIDQGKAAIVHLPPAERQKILSEAHRQAEQSRKEALRNLERDHDELTRQLEQQREQIETMRREIRQQAEALRDLARRESQEHRTRPGASAPPSAPTPPPAQPQPPSPPRR